MVTKVKTATAKLNRDMIRKAWEVRTKVEAEHFVMAGAYVGTGMLSEHESPAVMASAYVMVGVLHIVHVTRKGEK